MILLVMAASLPVMNTSVDPSSEVYNVMEAISQTLAKHFFRKFGAQQCVFQMAYGKAKPSYIKYDETIENVLKKTLESYYKMPIKDFKVDLRYVDFEIKLPKYGGPAIISGETGKVEQQPLGDISASVSIEVSVSYKVVKTTRQGPTEVFKKFIYRESFGVRTQTIEPTLIYNHVKEFVQAMPGWVQFSIGFIPVVGDVVQIENARTYYKYYWYFNAGARKEIVQYDGNGNEVARVSKEWGYMNYEIDPKFNEKLVVLFFNRPAYKVQLNKIPLTITYGLVYVELTEYYNIDWVAVVLGLLGLISVGDLAKVIRIVKSDALDDEGAEETLKFFKIPEGGFWDWKFFKKEEPPWAVKKPKETQASNMHNEGAFTFGNADRFMTLSEQEGSWEKIMRTVREYAEKKLTDQEFKAAADEINKAARDQFLQEAEDIDATDYLYSNELGQGLFQSTGSKWWKFFDPNEQDPFMYIIYPRNGGGVYHMCVWLEGFHPRIEYVEEGQ
ncbi:MAG: hypothetical protein NYU90_05755 [Aigarchaeota archaeon]|nr:hypothetical protein [Candidatus Calditenuis fumarioli]